MLWRQFDAAIAHEPNFAEAHGNRGSALSDLGRADEAVASYERAVALMPESIGDWINLGAAQHQLGRTSRRSQATTAYWRCSRIFPRRTSTAATS